MVTEGDLTWGSEHTIQYIDDMLQNCTPETYIILLLNVIPINSIKKCYVGKVKPYWFGLNVKTENFASLPFYMHE